MSDFLFGLLIGYIFVTLMFMLFGAIRYADARGPVMKQSGARMMFGAPLWPVYGAFIAARNFRQAWRDADWKGFRL